MKVFRRERIFQLNRLIEEARERLAEVLVEVSEIQCKIREVLEIALDRIGELQEKCDLLRLRIGLLRDCLHPPDEATFSRAERESEWRCREEQVKGEYERARKRMDDKKESVEDKGSKDNQRLRAVWKKLVKIYHPDRHQGDKQNKDAYENLMARINRAKDEGDLETLEEIAENPEKFIRECKADDKSDSGANSYRDGVKDLEELLSSLVEETRRNEEDLEELRGSDDYELWKMWKESPRSFESSLNGMEKELKRDIVRLQAELAKLEKMTEEKKESKRAA
jgi:DNA polymerase-3 subunit epsilon